MRKSGVAEKYVRVVQDMYERSRTVVRCAVGQIEEFKVEVGLHQGSALSPFLFAMVMDQLSEDVRQESPYTMIFADDIVICSESREQVEENLERWRFALERRLMKVSRSKPEYVCVNEREGSGPVRLEGEEVKKVQEFKYLGSTVQSNGECRKEVKKRVQAGWNGWRKVSGVLCDRKISARIKGKVYKTVVRLAMLYGLETVSLKKRQESELEVAELKMLRFSFGVTRLDRIRNEYIRGTAHVGRLGDKVREARLRWFGHVQRRESKYIGRRMLDMELPGRRRRGRAKKRQLEIVTALEDLNVNEEQNAVFMCEVSMENMSGDWYKNGQRIRPSSIIKTRREGKKHFLLICNVTSEDAGEIKFVSKQVESVAYLEVQELPVSIVRPLRNRTALENHRVILECTVSSPHSEASWHKGDIELESSERMDIISEGCYHKLVIHRVAVEDEGTYRIEVGKHTSTAKLLVEGK
ncbi:hypothetical protein PDJAM_G00104010 [Pangasius djambal]|uniref:Uncharacterized protein n=1 Tax=Pangasius djambal TaxID=1691987 RepID=A0ACC5Y1H4_9TELE|nr:hypothetical protein [Pangasius djambal]